MTLTFAEKIEAIHRVLHEWLINDIDKAKMHLETLPKQIQEILEDDSPVVTSAMSSNPFYQIFQEKIEAIHRVFLEWSSDEDLLLSDEYPRNIRLKRLLILVKQIQEILQVGETN